MKGCWMNIVAGLQLKLTMGGWLLALPALAVLCAAVQACQSQVSLPFRREFAWTGDMKQRHEIQGFSTSTSLISEKAKPRRLEGNSGTSLEAFSKAREELRFSSRFASISNFTMASLPTSCATWMGQVAFIRTTWYTSLRSLGSFKSAKPWRSRNAFTSFLRIGISVIGVTSNHNTKTKLARSWAKQRFSENCFGIKVHCCSQYFSRCGHPIGRSHPSIVDLPRKALNTEISIWTFFLAASLSSLVKWK